MKYDCPHDFVRDEYAPENRYVCRLCDLRATKTWQPLYGPTRLLGYGNFPPDCIPHIAVLVFDKQTEVTA